MPLAKRSVYPHHLCWAALPEGSELECVMNTTLSAIIHQLSSLSTQAEDMYRELFREAYTFYLQANTLQDRTNHLSFRVTQLDSSTEEGQLDLLNGIQIKLFRTTPRC
uniref:Uncharacterized protein n=1 Tax=Electrophorus electricus TaxID=8005 RepID=A0A4W4G815_ELEEL